ncbi:MAG: hypothetical protein EOQ47_20335 [Mesorhizobium sp.]|nr:MAG: hypothetical protein EOQ47_20335 [Mesorhizobium sp.]
MSPKATDEGCSRERQRLTPLEHPSSVSALRADPPSPTRGEGKKRQFQSTFNLFWLRLWTRRITFDSLMTIRACGVAGSSSMRQIGECHLWPRRTRGARPEGRLLRVAWQGATGLPATRA